MKRRFFSLLCLLTLIPVLVGCQNLDYYDYVSDERSDLFCAENEDFSLLISCIDRERPFLTDGFVSTKSKSVEVVLTEKEPTGKEYEVYFLEDVPRGGEMSFRSVTGDYSYSRGVEAFPQDSVSVRIVCGGEKVDLVATSVKNPHTLTAREALAHAVESEKEYISRLGSKNFQGEFHVRLLHRDKNYYYVGIIDQNGKTLSLLMDSETGAVLARREKN